MAECGGGTGDDQLTSLSYGGEEFQVPKELLEDVRNYVDKYIHVPYLVVGVSWDRYTRVMYMQEDVFCSVVSESTWREVLDEGDRERLIQLLPPGTRQEREKGLQ